MSPFGDQRTPLSTRALRTESERHPANTVDVAPLTSTNGLLRSLRAAATADKLGARKLAGYPPAQAS